MKILLTISLALATLSLTPCLWDSDTLDTELRGLPDSFDLIIGRWHRHSDAYYQNRVAQLTVKPALELAEFDDLAVAYEHLNLREQAIAVMARKADALAVTPDKEHQYRYHANLGTFYAHSGQFDEALSQLHTAVEINPEAHFGRERFQIELIEYVAAAKKNPGVWNRSFLRHSGYRLPMIVGTHWMDFMGPVDDGIALREFDWDEAHMAIGGMLRYGGLEGAELYRALGELYLNKRHLNLAWWAFNRAIERGHPATAILKQGQRGIVEHWTKAAEATPTRVAIPTQAEYSARRADADRWLAEFQNAEAAMVLDGKDVTSNAALQSLLASANRLVPAIPHTPATKTMPSETKAILLLTLMGTLAWLLFRALWRRSGAR
ncbi:MAG: tetratricopeptide repeat protein [Planctomycetota bacterium]|nr:tetratricopeptide repeat protein [Planctomycetota bacterium]